MRSETEFQNGLFAPICRSRPLIDYHEKQRRSVWTKLLVKLRRSTAMNNYSPRQAKLMPEIQASKATEIYQRLLRSYVLVNDGLLFLLNS